MKYEVFLSYAHKDADKYGRDYIDEIKRQIEASLGGEELVFLDADALELGDEWNSKIQECLDKCSVFVCLLSENYVKSEYCARERLWWAQKEMKKGRLNKATLPLFYVQIDDSADADVQWELERLSHLQNDVTFTPWFPEGAKFSARELVRRRLENARILSKIQSIKDDAETIGKSISSVPPYNQRFVGRVNELCRIRQVCTHGGMAIGSIPVIHGEAGCGKSEISFAYAHGYASEYPGGRFFVPMEQAKSWDDAWLRLAEETDGRCCLPVYEVLGLKEEDRQKESADLAKVIAQRMWIHIRNNGRTLFLLDNIDNMELLEDGMLTGLFPTGEVPDDLDMVATTRGTPVLDNCSMAVAVPIGDLGEEASLELLRLHCGNSPFNLAPPRNDRETGTAKELLKFLECHAWSVEIVAGYLGKEYRYGATPEKVLEDLRRNFQISATCRSFRVIPDCIEKLLQPSIDRIKQLEFGDEILELAGAAAMFSPDAVSVKLLKMLWRELHGEKPCGRKDSWLWAWETLKDYHLISPESNGISRMHRITHSFFRKYRPEKQLEWATKISEITAQQDKSAFSSEDAGALFGLAQSILGQPWRNDFLIAIIKWMDDILLEWYRINETKELMEKLESVVIDVDNQYTALRLLSVQGHLYSQTCQFANALEIYDKALEMQRLILPADHPDIATSYNNIGLVHYNKGKYDEALEMHGKALEIRCRALPADHPDIATSYNNIGLVHYSKGEYDKALEMHGKALEIRCRALPADHPDIATSYNNIGAVLDNKGEYDKALESCCKALDILRLILPADHPNIATSYSNIGAVLDSKGEYDKALESYCKALEIRCRALPADHPDIATSYNNIGFVHYSKGKYDEALEMHGKALEIQCRALPADHPDIAISYNNIGAVLDSKGEYDKALESYCKALEIRCRALPADHPDIATTYSNIGLVHCIKGEYDKAIACLKRAFEIYTKILGSEAPETRQCMELINNLQKLKSERSEG